MTTVKTKNKVLKGINPKPAINACNAAMLILVSQLANADYLLPFGNALNNPDFGLVAQSLISHRIVNKWYIPNKKTENALKQACFADWHKHEEKLSRFEFRDELYSCWIPAIPSDVGPCRPVFKKAESDMTFNHRKAQGYIRDWLRPVNYKLRAWDKYDVTCGSISQILDLDFTPGESYSGANGLTSVRQKLMLDKWTLTEELIPWVLSVITSHKSVREAAVERLKQSHIRHHVEWNDRVDLALVSGRITYDDWLRLNAQKYLLIIVSGARASSVAKNNQKRRFINIEPLFNMLYQRGVGLIIRDALKMVGNDLETGQDAHRTFICSMLYSTLDLRNASDSNIYIATRAFLRKSSPELWACIERSRSPTTTFYTTGTSTDCREIAKGVGSLSECGSVTVTNCKLSSMGNGFTFEVMTLLLLAQARVFDEHARVYGDDIMIRNDGPLGLNAAPMFIDLISTTGWEINPDKTFHDSVFYESCGGFVHNGKRLVSYDFDAFESIADLILCANKLREIIAFLEDLPLSKSNILGFLHDAHESIWAHIPSESKGPIRSLLVPSFTKRQDYAHTTVNCDYAEGENWERAHRRDESLRMRFVKHSKLINEAKKLGFIRRLPKGVVSVPRFKNNIAFAGSFEVQCPFQKAFYLYANRITNDTIRGKGRWSTVTCYIFDDGHVLPVATIKKYLLDYKRANQIGPKPYSYNTVYNDHHSNVRASLWNSTWNIDWIY